MVAHYTQASDRSPGLIRTSQLAERVIAAPP